MKGFSSQIMLCWPSDRQAIAQLNARVGPQQQFSPTIEHSLSTCDSCTQGIWIGPQQAQLSQSVFVNTRKLCLFCAGQAQKILGLTAKEVDINPGLADAPRRT